MQTRTLMLRDLRVHSAQMRTTLEASAMVELTGQVLERGLDAHQPIVTTPDGVVVSGHRRWLALLLAHAVRAQAREATPERADIERVVSETAVQAGDLAHAYDLLTEQHGQREVEVAVFEGDAAAQVLALQAANFGHAPADALGLAHSFNEAVRLGVAPVRIAANIGKALSFVENHLALAQLPPELAQLIAAGRLAMGVAPPLAALPEAKREALARVVTTRTQTSSVPTAPLVREAAQRLAKFQGFATPLTMDAVERNRARALAALWERALRETPHRAWVIAADAAYQNVLDDPANHPDHAAALVYAFDKTYVLGGKVDWTGVLRACLPEMTCDGCIVGTLPPDPLRDDLPLACRRGDGRPGACIAWISERDAFHLEAPWSWQGLPGVSAGPPYRVSSRADLGQAWQAKREVEQVEAVDAKPDLKQDTPGAVARSVDGSGMSTAADLAASAGEGTPRRAGAIEAMRSAIRHYMAHHAGLSGAAHPLATRCEACRHRLDRSPTRDETVPTCAWAAHQHNVAFKRREPVEGQAPIIPWCVQYAPAESDWSKRLPQADGAPGVSRAWYVQQIRFLAAHLTRAATGAMLEPLTGRPMKADENHGDWFARQFDEQVGRLSDGQLWTLTLWALADYQRLQGDGRCLLPTDGSGRLFAAYRIASFPEGTQTC